MRIINADVFGTDKRFHKTDVNIRDGIFVENNHAENDIDVINAEGCYAIPGLIDIHFHGAMGMDVCDISEDAFERIARYELSNGITAICPATLTLPEDDLCSVLSLGASFSKKSSPDCADLVGFNMEGPYISHAKKGAQNEKYIKKCDAQTVERFLESSDGLLKIIGLAPEENPDFEEYIESVKDRVTVSLAHTDADYDTATKAFDAGADHVVHLYNAMRGLSHREPGLVGAAADACATCEIICDGIHVHPSAVRAAYGMMGPENMILISDSLRCTGMPDGSYDLGGQNVIKKGALCTLEDGGNIAGSVSNLYDCMVNAVKTMYIPLEWAVYSATCAPAKRIGISESYGTIEPGKKAHLLLLDKDTLALKTVIKDGHIFL